VTTRIGPTRIGAVALVLVTTFGSACGFADKKALADRIRSAPARMDVARTARGRFALSAHVVRPKLSAAGFGRALAANASVALDIDFARRTAAAPGQMVSGPILYLRRPGASASDGRSWVKLDLRDLYDDREHLQASAFGANTLGPLVFIDLLHGALAGSVKRVGNESVNGVPATHYRANFAFDKAFDNAPEDLREGVEAALAVMGSAYDGISKGEVWLDAKGLPRRIAVTVREKRSRNEVVDLRFALDLFDFGAATSVHLPLNKDIERVKSVSELTAAAR
jgi:hypothetical protein